MKQKIVEEKPCTQMQGLEERKLCTDAMAKTGKDLDNLRIQTHSPRPGDSVGRSKGESMRGVVRSQGKVGGRDGVSAQTRERAMKKICATGVCIVVAGVLAGCSAGGGSPTSSSQPTTNIAGAWQNLAMVYSLSESSFGSVNISQTDSGLVSGTTSIDSCGNGSVDGQVSGSGVTLNLNVAGGTIRLAGTYSSGGVEGITGTFTSTAGCVGSSGTFAMGTRA